ncbi:Fe-S cluster assembly protein HesB [Actinobacteria bacterium YIM 96077]|uniref:Fe-S cluster assembly protein HesB n=1 Tax=Phytoactinopolyspora halophila TaxID=1981511 RepID=A0A329QP76_9ACTN|nr:HhH-GPD-type base excision DNA repair protein [Phytoactinopolyspora halophila]AYY13517.1 Fe-S cluster assembly protein HesB [Actinobacteria bacterium YIM 96077]RAW12428.1 Fe-S cluster assembly protein HesB [Phytoactinopolyspora halophila]
MVELHLVGEPAADELLARDPFALLVGMLLDQQVPMERAFAGPATIAARLGTRSLDPGAIAAYDPEEFASVLAEKPAVHRFPGSMAGKVQKLAAYVTENWGGDAGAIWRDAETGEKLLARLRALPGYGEQKARILLALLGKQFGVQPEGWREAAGPYGEQGAKRSVADVVDADSLLEVREFKRQAKRAAKG